VTLKGQTRDPNNFLENLKGDCRKKYQVVRKNSSVDGENLIKIAIHNFEKNDIKVLAKIP